MWAKGGECYVLNPDCVRNVLTTVENCNFGEFLNLDSLRDRLPQYSEEEIWYTCLKLIEGGFLDAVTFRMLRMKYPGIKSINGLTFNGHEFLNEIRTETNWNKVKTISQKAGVFSLSFIADIAKQVAAEAIKSALL